ncbi:MAG: hypothetical protein CSA03_01130 [Bacteroidetes bacterium]|nr:MAG: hypothetical protein CSA03_01130 [Bacteroidota bacterium]
MKKILSSIFLISTSLLAFGQTNAPNVTLNENLKVRGVAELGFVGVLDHKIQFSNNGTYFDYRKDGGQDVLFPVSRLSVEVEFKKRNTLTFLYQPLRLESQVLLDDDLIVDDALFAQGTSVKLLYNFPFYRLSYLRELLPKSEKYKFAVGGTVQIRNATISFESADGTLYRTNRDVGIVPALKIRGRANLNERFYLGLEADGIYAPVSYLNGSDNEVVGAILDASVRGGVKINDPVSAFLNLRYLGGGAVGTSDDTKGPGDGYVKNWLHFATVSLGFIYEF